MRGSAQSDECRVLLPLILATQVRFLHWLQSVVPLRKELTISRIIDNPSEMMTNWVLPNNTEVLNLTFGVVAQQVEQ